MAMVLVPSAAGCVVDSVGRVSQTGGGDVMKCSMILLSAFLASPSTAVPPPLAAPPLAAPVDTAPAAVTCGVALPLASIVHLSLVVPTTTVEVTSSPVNSSHRRQHSKVSHFADITPMFCMFSIVKQRTYYTLFVYMASALGIAVADCLQAKVLATALSAILIGLN